MGNTNSSTRDSRPSGSRSRSGTANNQNDMYNVRSGSGRGSRQNLSFLHLGSSSRGEARTEEPRRETKQEREARRRERERVARENERERSIREEGVDGGFLVTLGTYTGPEDFNKAVVRQLMIERRLAPFWKGLNDHNDSWTENQFVAVVRGLPLPAPDDPPLPDLEPVAGAEVNSLTVPISSRSQSYQSDTLPSSTFPRPGSSSLPSVSGSRNLFRDRAKTLASLGTSTKGGSATSIAPQEIQLPRDPRVNGTPIEAVLYKDASECPICFLYYPPYLNKTRCCDQPICSECFVQIKRPDPHPPEHHDDEGNPTPTPDEEGLLVSEPAACPFCVTPEFGVTYGPPSFRRGLVYPGPVGSPGATSFASPASSSTSLNAQPTRRRTTSMSASAPNVITTDRVRPDWAKKLADARAHALRRSAAATALHNAAYMLGNNQPSDSRSFGLGRRRRTLFAESSASASGTGTPRIPENTSLGSLSQLIAQIEGQTQESRQASRRSRTSDLEDLMMMEAIRLSLASEEERKKKEEKEARKDAKKREKEAAKEAKKAEKAARKSGSLYNASMNGSTATWSSMTRSTSNIPRPATGASTSSSPPPPVPSVVGKGKAPAHTAYGFNPLSEPTSTLNTEASEIHQESSLDNAQKHLEESRANLPQSTQPITFPDALQTRSGHLRHVSNASSAASSVLDSAPGSYQRTPSNQLSPNASGTRLDDGTGTPDTQSGTPGNDVNTESMFNFNSLSQMIRDDKDRDAEHVEYFEQAEEEPRNSSVASSSKVDAAPVLPALHEDEGEAAKRGNALRVEDRPETAKPGQMESKHVGDVNILNTASTTH